MASILETRCLEFEEDMETSSSNVTTFVNLSSSQPLISSSQNQPSKKSITTSIASLKKVRVKNIAPMKKLVVVHLRKMQKTESNI